jgi:hypothetical protein
MSRFILLGIFTPAPYFSLFSSIATTIEKDKRSVQRDDDRQSTSWLMGEGANDIAKVGSFISAGWGKSVAKCSSSDDAIAPRGANLLGSYSFLNAPSPAIAAIYPS